MMGTAIILESLQIIICHKSNFNLESFFLLFILHLFNIFVYLYIVVNLFNKLHFR
jgi:hypothetical protein